MKSKKEFESFATTCNGLDGRLPIMNRCYNIGMWGGCELRCAAFCDGECEVPYEFGLKDIVEEFDDDELREIFSYYPKFLSTDNNPNE